MISTWCWRCEGLGAHDFDCYGLHPEGCDGSEGHVCAVCKGEGEQSVMVYANIYAVQRFYGGPEEGGWWYDAGYPLGSVRVDPSWDRDLVISMLRRLYADEQAERGRGSVIGGPDVEIYFEPHFAEEWPKGRPQYE